METSRLLTEGVTPSSLSPLTLAFVGDGVYGLMVREHLDCEANRPVGTLHKASVELVRAEAKRWGVRIIGTELSGLAPMQALADSAAYYLQLEEYDFDRQVLENYLLEE